MNKHWLIVRHLIDLAETGCSDRSNRHAASASFCCAASNCGAQFTARRRTARRARNDRKFTGALLSQRLWCAASVARRAALRLLPRLPDISHPFSDVARPPDRPRCHANFARHPLSETHKPSLPALDPVPLRSGTGHGPLRLEPCDPPTFHSRAANRY
jgi:hypothetical protein